MYITFDPESCLHSKIFDCFEPLIASWLLDRFDEYILIDKQQHNIRKVKSIPNKIGETGNVASTVTVFKKKIKNVNTKILIGLCLNCLKTNLIDCLQHYL